MLSAAALVSGRSLAWAGAGNGTLIPATNGSTPSYWCTWYAQVQMAESAPAGYGEASGHTRIARVLTEDAVFGPSGWAKQHFPAVRADLYLGFDLGWDVRADENFDRANWLLGSHIVASDKFPSCMGSPYERLRKLNQMTKAAGWRGAGLWVPAQVYGDGKDGKRLEDVAVRRYLLERLEWSRSAGIEYWKVDYGARGGDVEFRLLMTRLAHEVCPTLVVEHAINIGPLNDESAPWDTTPATHSGRFGDWENGARLRSAVEVAKFSRAFRTYDVTEQLAGTTTLDRVGQELLKLSNAGESAATLNCEDEVYIAAALGLAMGVMRYPGPAIADEESWLRRIDEVTRAVRWQRMAPAFGAGTTSNRLSEAVLTDVWPVKAGETWATYLNGTVVKQGAPSIIARNMPLPKVKTDGDPPFLVCARHPRTETTAIYALPRRSVAKGKFVPKADVEALVNYPARPIGIFGRYGALKLIAERDWGKTVLAQDLAGEKVTDITSQVKLAGRQLIIPGQVIDTVGTSAGTKGDGSAPGLVLSVR